MLKEGSELGAVQVISSTIICFEVMFLISIVKSPVTFIPETVKICSSKSSKAVEVPFDSPFIKSSTCLSPLPVKAL